VDPLDKRHSHIVRLFCVRHIETRKEAIISGIAFGAIGMTPVVFMFFAMLSQYPNVLNTSVPVNAVLDKIGKGFKQKPHNHGDFILN
jgi:uncharacterized membrane protein YkvI